MSTVPVDEGVERLIDDALDAPGLEFCECHNVDPRGFGRVLARSLRSERDAELPNLRGANVLLDEKKAELRRAMAVAQAAIDWQADTGGCHFCGFGLVPDYNVGLAVLHGSEAPLARKHDDDCPLVENGFITPDGGRKA